MAPVFFSFRFVIDGSLHLRKPTDNDAKAGRSSYLAGPIVVVVVVGKKETCASCQSDAFARRFHPVMMANTEPTIDQRGGHEPHPSLVVKVERRRESSVPPRGVSRGLGKGG